MLFAAVPPAAAASCNTKAYSNRWFAAVCHRLVITLPFLTLWTVASKILGDYWFPSPWATVSAFGALVTTGSLGIHLAYTGAGALLGLAGGFIPGVTLALLWYARPAVLTTLEPFVAAGYALPKLALAPLFMLWLDLGLQSTIAVVAASTFFLGYLHAAAGIKAADSRLQHMVLIFGGASRHVIRYVVIPGATPYVLAGLRLAIPYGIGITVVSEMLSSNRGVGYVVQFGAMNFDTAEVFAALVIVTLFAASCDRVLRVAERRFTPWIERKTGTCI